MRLRPHLAAQLDTALPVTRAVLGAQMELGQAYRSVMVKHDPAMTLVEVQRLVVPGAVVEIEATAVLCQDHAQSRLAR